MFSRENIVYLLATRGVQRSKVKATHRNYVTRETIVKDEYTIEWKGRERSGIFGLSPKDQHDEIESLIAAAKLGDIVVEQIQYCFQSPAVVAIINANYLAKGKKPLAPATKLYATFKAYCGEELDHPMLCVHQLNQKEISELGFRIATLDLVDLKTERAVKYKERERIPVNSDSGLIDTVLHEALDWNGWPVALRTLDKAVPNPCAIRQYRLSSEKEWELYADKG